MLRTLQACEAVLEFLFVRGCKDVCSACPQLLWIKAATTILLVLVVCALFLDTHFLIFKLLRLSFF